MHTFRVHGLDHALRVVRFEGTEGLSELFAFDVTLAGEDRDIAFDAVVNQPAVLEIRAGDDVRHVHGIVSDFEQGDEGKRLTAYRATLVPAVSRLRHRRASRIFQGDSVPEIIEKILRKAGVPSDTFRFALRSSYAPREYCVQYREADWAFVSRLMEEEGISYGFEHTEDKAVVVFGDSPAARPPIAGKAEIPFHPPTGALIKGEHIARFRWSERVRPGKVTLRDYNFKKPTLSLERSTKADSPLEVYDYPGDYEEPGPGATAAEVRLEELQTPRRTGDGDSTSARLVPGFTFSLADHPRDDFNRSYLVTRVDHRGFDPHLEGGVGDDASYENRFEVTAASAPFRPAQVTPRPFIRGVQTAIVVGPKGEEIYTDEHGRVKVKFHWDREGKGDETSSCWIRVSQIWAGGAWGAVFLPRVGHEVVVDFLEGDPDRPLVVGSVYHGTNVPPYALPAEKTKSTIKSRSSPGGGGFNEIRFEDKKGQEEIFVHGQKDWNILIEHDKGEEIGHDEALRVKHDRKKRVDNDQAESIGGNKTIDVAKMHTETIGENATIAIGGTLGIAVTQGVSASIGGNSTLDISGSEDTSIQESMSLSVGKGKSETVGGSSAESVAKSKSVSVDESYTVSVSEDMTVTIGKNAKEEVGEKKTVIAGKELSIQVGDATITVKKNGDITVQGKKIVVKGTGPIQVEGKKLDVKSDGDVSVQASGKVKVNGSNVEMN